MGHWYTGADGWAEAKAKPKLQTPKTFESRDVSQKWVPSHWQMKLLSKGISFELELAAVTLFPLSDHLRITSQMDLIKSRNDVYRTKKWKSRYGEELKIE